jgi:hypothetical protein
MEAFILTKQDFQKLLDTLDRDPQYGKNGGSSVELSDLQKKAFIEAHSFYNFHIRKWIDSVKE